MYFVYKFGDVGKVTHNMSITQKKNAKLHEAELKFIIVAPLA